VSSILSFGGPSREAVVEAYLDLVGDEKAKIFVLSVEEEKSLDYREFDGTLEAALATLAEGRNASIQIQSKASSLLAGIYRPGFAQERLLDWSASVEGEDFDADSAFDEIQSVDGLTYVALSKDECLDFDVEHVTRNNFPWSDWRLKAGAARDDQGIWVTRCNN